MEIVKPKILIPQNKIEAKVKELAEKIYDDYRGKDLTIVGVLKGSVIFLSDLIRNLELTIFIDFLEVSSYGDKTKSSGIVKIVKDLTHTIEGQDVLLVEDIVDTGLTLSYLVESLTTRRPNSLRVCVFLEKKDSIIKEVPIDYKGFSIENKFVVGYGLDYRGMYRNLNYIGYLEDL